MKPLICPMLTILSTVVAVPIGQGGASSCLGLIGGTAARAPDSGATSDKEHSHQLKAIVGSWLASDRNIRSVVYAGETHFVRDADPSHLLHMEGKFGEDAVGNWFVDAIRYTYATDQAGDTLPEKSIRERVATEGGDTRWWFESDHFGSIGPESDYRMMTVSPFILIGRRMTIAGHPPTPESLPELLLDGELQSGQWVERDNRRFYRVQGVISSSRGAHYRVVADLDPEAGFMPVRISSYRPGFNSEHVRLTVDEYQEVRPGVFLPIRGSQSLFNHRIVSDQERDHFTISLSEADIDLSLVDPRRADDVARLHKVVTQVFGPSGYPTEELLDENGGRYQVRALAYERVNEELTAEELLRSFPKGSLVFDAYTDAYYRAKDGAREAVSEDEVDRHFRSVRSGD